MVAIVLSAIFVICAGIIIIIPQIWLVKNATLFLVYWTLMILSAIDKRAVCSQCEKCFCPLNKKFKTGRSLCRNDLGNYASDKH